MNETECPCEKCKGPTIPDCTECRHNIGIENSAGRIDGPCGQQNCFYGCTVCAYNGYAYFDDGKE